MGAASNLGFRVWRLELSAPWGAGHDASVCGGTMETMAVRVTADCSSDPYPGGCWVQRVVIELHKLEARSKYCCRSHNQLGTVSLLLVVDQV